MHCETLKTQFFGVPPLHYVLVCKTQIYMLKMTLSISLTYISFSYIKFANILYITNLFCSQANNNRVLIPRKTVLNVKLIFHKKYAAARPMTNKIGRLNHNLEVFKPKLFKPNFIYFYLFYTFSGDH